MKGFHIQVHLGSYYWFFGIYYISRSCWASLKFSGTNSWTKEIHFTGFDGMNKNWKIPKKLRVWTDRAAAAAASLKFDAWVDAWEMGGRGVDFGVSQCFPMDLDAATAAAADADAATAARCVHSLRWKYFSTRINNGSLQFHYHHTKYKVSIIVFNKRHKYNAQLIYPVGSSGI